MMPNDTEQAPAGGSRTWAWCSWHENFSSTARLVRAIEQCSGPGHSLYACADCRKTHNLMPLADRP